MTTATVFDAKTFWTEMDTRIAKHDLLCHPFYQAWSAGELAQDDLRDYATQYFHHVAAYPAYLSALHSRLDDGELRRAVLRNLCDEEIDGRAHSELWLDFAEGMGAARKEVRQSIPLSEVSGLVRHFKEVASTGSVAAALAAMYAYESQVPRVAIAKAKGLHELYGADAKTCGYFKLHQTADVHHSQVWREQIESVLGNDPAAAQESLEAAEEAASALWKALDGIERERLAKRTVAVA